MYTTEKNNPANNIACTYMSSLSNWGTTNADKGITRKVISAAKSIFISLSLFPDLFLVS